jgi:hypothetical protein
MQLHHFSDDRTIERFTPRPVRVPSLRRPGEEWLNGPLVWAVEARRAPMYLFPRECPRILIWSTPNTTEEDRRRWLGATAAATVAYIEWDWLEPVRTDALYRYDLPTATFEDLQDAGMFVSRQAVVPIAMETISDLPAALRGHGVELRICERLTPMRGAGLQPARQRDPTAQRQGLGVKQLRGGAARFPSRTNPGGHMGLFGQKSEDDKKEDRGLTRGSSGATADAAVQGKVEAEDRSVDGPSTRAAEPLGETEKPDQLADKAGQSENRQEALLDEGIEESFPASDPPSAKRIT